jgi:hypothetical protein
MTDFRDFESSTSFAAEGSSESSAKIELTPFQKGLVAVTGVGLAATAVGVGVYWANKGLRETAKNIGDAADGIKEAHAKHEQKKAAKAIANAAIAEAVNQG